MLHEMCAILANCICKNNYITDNDKKEVVTYGFEILVSTVINVIIVLLIGFINKRLFETILFLISFMPLRTYSGGYHATTHMRCFLILLGCVMVQYVLLNSLPINIINVLSITMLVYGEIVIFILAPIIDNNHPMSKQQINNIHKICKTMLLIILLIALVFFELTTSNYIFSFSYGVAITGTSMIIAKIKIILSCKKGGSAT